MLDKIANAKDVKELRKLAQLRYSWQEKSTRSSKSAEYEANPNYDADKANAVESALAQRASDFGLSLAALQSEDKISARERRK